MTTAQSSTQVIHLEIVTPVVQWKEKNAISFWHESCGQPQDTIFMPSVYVAKL